MNRATRHHVDRRSLALERLESITVGAAIAGVAGTLGFGTLAAVTFSGTANAADRQSDQNLTTDPGSGSNDDGLTPRTNDDGGSPFFQVQPAPRTSAGRGHASTGGSG
jgi:hypothetical protein